MSLENNLPKDWVQTTLGDIISSGEFQVKNNLRKPISSNIRSQRQGKYPYYGAANAIDFIDQYKIEGFHLLIAEDGTVSSNGVNPMLQLVEGKFNVSNHAHILQGKERWQTNFLYYVLSNVNINPYVTGAVQPKLNKKNLLNIQFGYPTNQAEQKAIAEVLSSLDDKIDLLHRQNKTLEQMAETLFRQWFIEEADENWEDGKLEDIIEFNPVYKMRKGERAPYLEMKNVSTTNFNPENYYYRDFTSGIRFKNKDTIIARITPCLENGKTAFVTFLNENQIGWGSTEYIIMRMKGNYHKFLSYLIAKNNDFRDHAINSMSGSSGRQRAQVNVMKEYEIKIPTDNVINKINVQLDPIVEKMKYNAIQITTLENLRDTLLPKLMSGEIRIKYE